MSAQTSRAKKSGGKPGKRKSTLTLDDLDQLEAQRETLIYAQAELEESRNQYAELYDRSPVGYVTLGGNGQIKKINFAAAILLGGSRESFKNANLNRFVRDKVELEKFLAHLRHCRDEEINVTTPLFLKTRGGEIRPVELISYPIANDERIYHTAILDLTEREKSERAIRASEERFRNMANNVPVLIWIADTTKACTWFNEQWLNFVGRPMEKETGNGWAENVHRDDLAACVKIYSEKFDARQSFEMEYRLRRHDGNYRWILDHGTPTRGETGKFTGYIGTCLDITDRRRAEDELKRMHDEIERTSHAKDDFLAALSHELRTPLNPVLLLASDAAKNPELSPRVRTDFDIIRKNVELEARLIDDLLDMTRVARGKLTLEMREVDVHAVLTDALANVQSEIEQKKISLELKPGAAQHTILGDAVRLQQVFWNVLKNAVKFTPESGEIFVSTKNIANEMFVAKIVDNGIGINAGEVEHIFDAFLQGSHATAHRFGGLGLGLAISRALIEKQSVRIHAESAGKGLGATFIIELPLIKKVEKKAPAKSSVRSRSVAPKNLNGEKAVRHHILLVEDHEPTRTSLTQLLLRRNFKVTAAGSLAEARLCVEKEKFDLLISDIGLPDGNGFDLMKEVGERDGLKGIALTGYGMEQDMNRSYAAGFITHLTKPVRMESLDEALAAILGPVPKITGRAH